LQRGKKRHHRLNSNPCLSIQMARPMAPQHSAYCRRIRFLCMSTSEDTSSALPIVQTA
jgi:hypothetical protein